MDADFLTRMGTTDWSLVLGIHDRSRDTDGNEHDEPAAQLDDCNGGGAAGAGQSHYGTEAVEDVIPAQATAARASDSSSEDDAAASLSTGRLEDATGRYVYYLGIIDVLQPYNLRRVLERLHFGLLLFPLANVSVAPPAMYADRFLRAINSRIV